MISGCRYCQALRRQGLWQPKAAIGAQVSAELAVHEIPDKPLLRVISGVGVAPERVVKRVGRAFDCADRIELVAARIELFEVAERLNESDAPIVS